MKYLSVFTIVFLSTALSFARVEVLFHPYDPTLEKISEVFQSADHRIDIAMYNMETSTKSPIIAALALPKMQKRIQSGELQIRLIFEGYGTPEENATNMKRLEALGIDVRYLNASKKIHHKFAVVDADSENPKLISGSANWSLSSRANYNENIFFIEDEKEISKQFQNEFELLWTFSQEYGETLNLSPLQFKKIKGDSSLLGHFNSENYIFSKEGVTLKRDQQDTLTSLLSEKIQSAQKEIFIATTRIHLEDVKEALVEAMSRKVKVWIVVSMDEYMSSHSSTRDLEAAGAQVRIKYYNLKKTEYLQRQMHHKYMIIDSELVLSGSFNWSPSSEKSHIENVIELSGADHPEALQRFLMDFKRLWTMNRDQYKQTLDKVSSSDDMKCGLVPMVLYRGEINALLKAFKGKSCHN
ncbi:MAG: hypothetical protein BroJett040_20520 [Oligoflexia bacterium]|nr:MAG: hypothetical protein BroJett040_20520 [Oligoflexia bacterium]